MVAIAATESTRGRNAGRRTGEGSSRRGTFANAEEAAARDSAADENGPATECHGGVKVRSKNGGGCSRCLCRGGDWARRRIGDVQRRNED